MYVILNSNFHCFISGNMFNTVCCLLGGAKPFREEEMQKDIDSSFKLTAALYIYR